MAMDVIDLRDFYESGLGRLARRLVLRRIRQLWPDVRGDVVLGLGYATPYLRAFRDEAGRVIALMPAAQGVLHWPPGEAGLVALAEESELPLPDLSADRIILAHGLEFSEQVRPLLREIWRLLSDRGRLLIVAPNRRGIWARFEHTPFGQGLPYTPGQLSRLLRENMFTPIRIEGAVHIPPIRSRMFLTTALAWERVGEPWLGSFGGVVVIEAAKQIYAAEPARVAARQRRRIYLPATDAT
ncbi:MAG: methyltransferase domain-containing protein [Alphaproteobacteria bacterium]